MRLMMEMVYGKSMIAQEIVVRIRPFVQGIYMMPAFGRYDLVADVVDVVKRP